MCNRIPDSPQGDSCSLSCLPRPFDHYAFAGIPQQFSLIFSRVEAEKDLNEFDGIHENFFKFFHFQADNSGLGGDCNNRVFFFLLFLLFLKMLMEFVLLL